MRKWVEGVCSDVACRVAIKGIAFFCRESHFITKKGGVPLRHSPIPTYHSRLLVSFVKKGFTALRRQGILRGILHRIIAHRVARSRALQIG